ncbi:MAG: phosphoglycolate phosphatase [Sulfitobacter sp.]|nr:phosphoglycolate phosphatase [Sulfitobacter sp.]
MTDNRPIIFDLDGTLVHSAPDLHAALNVTLTALDRPTLDLATVISFIGNGVDKLVERGLRATGGAPEHLLREAIAGFRAYYGQNAATLTRPYPGVVDTLVGLQKAGHPLGICTNKPTEPARFICSTLRLSDYFDIIQGAEPDLAHKPDAEPLLRVITALGGAAESALFVGDSEVDYLTARSANVPFRLFTGGYLHVSLPDLATEDRFDDWHNCQIG